MFGELPALVFGLLSAACVVTTTFWNQWSISSTSSNGLLGPIWAFKYLFGECIQYQAGQFQCQELESQFLIPGKLPSSKVFFYFNLFLSSCKKLDFEKCDIGWSPNFLFLIKRERERIYLILLCAPTQ